MGECSLHCAAEGRCGLPQTRSLDASASGSCNGVSNGVAAAQRTNADGNGVEHERIKKRANREERESRQGKREY